jgi:hypothetical protein
MTPPSSYKSIDTLKIARKYFGFTSNKLAYTTSALCKKYKKMAHSKFPGFELWKECLAGNTEAWTEMAIYNKYDILSLEELYHIMIPWTTSIDFNLYREGNDIICKCGSKDFMKRGFFFSPSGKFQRFRCNGCGAETRSKENQLTPRKRKYLRPSTTR